MSRSDKLLTAAGKAPSDLYNGVRQLLGADNQSDIDETAGRDKALLDDPWGLAGNMLGNAGLAYLGARAAGPALGKTTQAGTLARIAANPYAANAVTGATFGALGPVESGSSREGQTALGGAAGAAGTGIAQGLGALVRSAADKATPAVRYLADRASEFGIPVRAADISSSPVLSFLQRAVDYLPFSGAQAQQESSQKAFNKALNSTMGQEGDDITAGLRGARSRISSVYDSVLGRNSAELDPTTHGQKLLGAYNNFRRLDTSPNKTVSDTLDDYLTNLIHPDNATLNPLRNVYKMDGPVYKQFRSEAAQQARQYRKTGDSNLENFFNSVKETLDHSIRNSGGMSARDSAALGTADRQWANMRTLENLAPKDASGDVDFNRLASVLTQKDADSIYSRNNFIYGGGNKDLPDLARIGTQFLGRGQPPSQMNQAFKYAKKMATPTIGLGAVGGLYATNSHEEHPVRETVAELAALAALSKSAGSALNSQWFARGASPAVRGMVHSASPLAEQLPTGALTSLLRRGAPELPTRDELMNQD
jgi:hypothetical protein